jgi:palmitoyltransferase
MWINNCVGGLNYRPFFVMIITAFSNLLLYVSALLILTLEQGSGNYLAGFIAAWLSGGINSIFVILLFNLILLHLYLFYKGISTYEFIVAQREQ